MERNSKIIGKEETEADLSHVDMIILDGTAHTSGHATRRS